MGCDLTDASLEETHFTHWRNISKNRSSTRSFNGHKLLFHTHVRAPFPMSNCCSSHPGMEYFCILSNQGISVTHSYWYKWCKQSHMTSEGQPSKSLTTWNAALGHHPGVGAVEGKSALSCEELRHLAYNQYQQPDEWSPLGHYSQGSSGMKLHRLIQAKYQRDALSQFQSWWLLFGILS